MKPFQKYVFAAAILVVLCSYSFPEKGVPPLENYTPEHYLNKGKIWDIKSAPNGIVYMASDYGFLEYDGKTWKGYKGSTGFTRSVLVANDSVVYTGSDLDFGVWNKNEYQEFDYTSLYPFLNNPSDLNEEFWNIHKIDESIVFVSAHNLYVYRNEQFTKISSNSKLTGSFLVDGTLYFADDKYGLYVFSAYSLKPLAEYPEVLNLDVKGIFQRNDELIIVTRDHGLFSLTAGILTPANNSLSEVLKTANVFSFGQINEKHLVFGTILKGLYVTDLDGNIIHNINKHKGLPNNTILSLHFSNSGKLWVGMDYGISEIDFREGTSFFNDYRGDFGTAQTALLKNDVFFMGTNQGLYTANWDDLDNHSEYFNFQIVKGSEGQVWTLKSIGNEILVGHDKGLLITDGKSANLIVEIDGVWTIIPYKEFLLTGNYNGISILEKSGGKWVFKKKMDLIYGSCNQLIVEDENVLWVNIPNFGIIRAVLDENLDPVERLIIPENDFEGKFPSLYIDDEGIKVLTDSYSYSFCQEKRVFEKETERLPVSLAESLEKMGLSYIWLNDEYKFIPISNGFALKQTSPETREALVSYSLVFRGLKAFNNKQKARFRPGDKIPSALNNITIEFIVPNKKNVHYQFSLNRSDNWSSLSHINTFDFFGLESGKYILYVRALVNGVFTEVSSLDFRVAAPWYKTWIAFITYFLLVALLIIVLNKYQIKLLKKQKKELLKRERQSLLQQAEKHRQQLMKIEQEKLREENDLIKNQLKNKTIELAKKAKDNEDKNRLLIALKEKCEKAKRDPNSSSLRLNEMKRLMDAYLNLDDRTFEIQMDELHQEFFKKLRKRFPELSSNDLRLCAYLKIGLSSKEISEIFNIQPSSIFISRSRLRKKLNLTAEEDLFGFLNGI